MVCPFLIGSGAWGPLGVLHISTGRTPLNLEALGKLVFMSLVLYLKCEQYVIHSAIVTYHLDTMFCE